MYKYNKRIIGETIYKTDELEALNNIEVEGKTVFIDYETDMARDNQPVLLTFIVAESDDAYLIVGKEAMTIAIKLLGKARLLVAHNAHFEASITYKWFGHLYNTYYCTMLAHQCLYNDPKDKGVHSFAALIQANFKVKLSKDLQTTFTVGKELTASQIKYAFDDVVYLQPLYAILDSEIIKNEQEMEITLECGIIPAMAKAEVTGIKLDIDRVKENIALWESELIEVEEALRTEWSKFLPLENPYYKKDTPKEKELNLGSSKQVTFLFMFLGYQSNEVKKKLAFYKRLEKVPYEYQANKLGFMPKNDKTGNDTTSSADLKQWLENNLDTPLWDFIEVLFRHRELNKLISQYGYGFLKVAKPVYNEDGTIKEYRIHSRYLQRHTNTGRFSSTNPNIQNLPRLKIVRNMLIADEGTSFYVSDFSGQEVIIAADKSLEPVLINALVTGLDHHSFLAKGIYEIIFNKSVFVGKTEEPLQEVIDLEGTTQYYKPVQLRNDSKGNLFTKFYGGGAARMLFNMMPYIKKHIKPEDRGEIGKAMAAFFSANLPVLTAWSANNLSIYQEHGYIVPSIIGRRIRFKQRAYGDILNAPIQSTGADAMKLAIFYIHTYIVENKLENVVMYLFNVHDEIVLQIKDTHLHLVSVFDSLMKQALNDLLSEKGKELGLKAEVESMVIKQYTK